MSVNTTERAKYVTTINDAGAFYGVSPALLDAVYAQESGYDPTVISGRVKSTAGATGIAQFIPSTAEQLGVNPTDPVQSIYGSALYLRELLDMYQGDAAKALAAYNAGAGNVNNAIATGGNDWISHLPGETQTYLSAIGNTLNNGSPVAPGDLWNTLKDKAATLLKIGATGGAAGIIEGAAQAAPTLNSNVPVVGGALNAVNSAGDFLKWLYAHLSDPHWWARIGLTIVAGVLIVGGLILYFKPVRDIATKAAIAGV